MSLKLQKYCPGESFTPKVALLGRARAAASSVLEPCRNDRAAHSSQIRGGGAVVLDDRLPPCRECAYLLVDDRRRLVSSQPEDLSFAQQVRPSRQAAIATDEEREFVLTRGLRLRWDDIKDWRQASIVLPPRDDGMIAGMVITIRDQRVEHRSAEELAPVSIRLAGSPPDLLGQPQVGPPAVRHFVGVEEGQPAEVSRPPR